MCVTVCVCVCVTGGMGEQLGLCMRCSTGGVAVLPAQPLAAAPGCQAAGE